VVLRSRSRRLLLAALFAALPLAGTLPAHASTAPRPVHHAGVRGHATTTAATSSSTQLLANGGPVLANPSVYLSFWGGSNASAQSYLESFFSAVGGSGWANVPTQYCSNAPVGATTCAAGSAFAGNPAGQWRGSWGDSTPVPTTPVDTDIESAALRAVKHFGFRQDAVYFVMTPSGHSESGFGTSWCAWHGSTSNGSSQIPYAYLPYQPDAGAACGVNSVNATTDSFGHGIYDGFSIVGGHEYLEAVTDPFPNTGWLDSAGLENGDKCQWSAGPVANYTFGSTYFAVQPTWSNASAGCAMSMGSTPAPSPTPTPTPNPAPAPSSPTGLYSLDGYGGVHALGSSAALSTSAYWGGWDIARGIATFKDGSGGYVLDAFGGLHQFGSAAAPQSGCDYWPGWDIARAVVLAPWATAAVPQGWVLDGWGALHPFNGAPAAAAGAYWPGWDIARGVLITPDSTPSRVKGYTLDGWGGLHALNGAAPVAQSAYWQGWDIARAVVWSAGATSTSPAGYVVDGWGGLHPFGVAAVVSGSGYWPGQDLVRGAAAWPQAGPGTPGGWVLRADGSLYRFGSAPAVAGPTFGGSLGRGLAGG